MLDVEHELPVIDLQPGESVLAREPTIIRTILGSCVSISFWNERLHIGALCHSILPRMPLSNTGPPSIAIGRRYVDFCIRDLAQQFDELGIGRHEVQVKLFGGADVLVMTSSPSRPTVGRLNCETAIDLLSEEGYTITASSLGDIYGRKIRFNTGTGEVLQLRLR